MKQTNKKINLQLPSQVLLLMTRSFVSDTKDLIEMIKSEQEKTRTCLNNMMEEMQKCNEETVSTMKECTEKVMEKMQQTSDKIDAKIG